MAGLSTDGCGFLEQRLVNLDDMACALDVIVDAAAPVLDENNSVIAGALRAITKAIAAQNTETIIELKKMQADPEWNGTA